MRYEMTCDDYSDYGEEYVRQKVVPYQFAKKLEQEVYRLESDNLALREKVVELEKDKARLEHILDVMD